MKGGKNIVTRVTPVKWYPACAECGSDNIEVDAYVRWDQDNNDWYVATDYESYRCDDCGDEGKYYDEKVIKND